MESCYLDMKGIFLEMKGYYMYMKGFYMYVYKRFVSGSRYEYVRGMKA